MHEKSKRPLAVIFPMTASGLQYCGFYKWCGSAAAGVGSTPAVIQAAATPDQPVQSEKEGQQAPTENDPEWTGGAVRGNRQGKDGKNYCDYSANDHQPKSWP